MKVKKRAPRKKDVAEPEEIQTLLYDLFSRVSQTFEKYRSVVLASLSILVILCVAVVVYYYLSQKWNKEASLLENSAYNYYIEGDYQKALSTYQKIEKDYSASKSMAIAMYYAGNSYLALGQNDQAIQAYQKFIEKYKNQDTILPLVYVNLGYAHMNKKDYSNAISAFKQASTLKNSFVADRAVYETARAHEISGDKVSAIERYEYLIKTYPSSPWAQDASAKLNKAQGATVKEEQKDKK